MQKLNFTRSFLALSAASLALLPLAGSVQAKPQHGRGQGPPDFAPAYGRRNQDGKSRGNNRPNGENYGRTVTLEGVVTSRTDNNEFEVRAGGRTFDVTSNYNVNLRQGDRVVLRGSFDGNDNFSAETVRVLGRDNGNYNNGNYDNNGGYDNNGSYGNGGYNNGGYNDDRYRNGQNVTFSATFVRHIIGNFYEVRADSGRTFRIETRDNVRSLRNGDRVQVSGTFAQNRIINAHLNFNGDSGSSNNGGYYNGGYNNGGTNYGNGSYSGNERTVDFPARIVSLDSRNKTAVVRGDNGRTYRVTGSELKGFKTGERVRVRGTSRNGIIDLQDLDKIR